MSWRSSSHFLVGDLLPQAHQDPELPVRFLKRRHFFTPQGVVIAAQEKYVDELVKLYGLQGRALRATPDVPSEQAAGRELDVQDKRKFRSGMGTLLNLCQDRIDIQHAVRHLSQSMSKPTKVSEDGLKRVIKGTGNYGLLMPYHVSGNSKLEEIMQRQCGDGAPQRVEVFTDSDWAGDRSGPREGGIQFPQW